MVKRFRPLYVCILIFCFSFSVLYPQQLWGFFDEDTLKTTGIIIGITFGVCLVVVLIAGTMKDLKGEPDDLFTRLHLQTPPEDWQHPLRFFGIDQEPVPPPSPYGNKPIRYADIIAREGQMGKVAPLDPTFFRFSTNANVPNLVLGQDKPTNPPG